MMGLISFMWEQIYLLRKVDGLFVGYIVTFQTLTSPITLFVPLESL
jgi:thiamine transporter ThiT